MFAPSLASRVLSSVSVILAAIAPGCIGAVQPTPLYGSGQHLPPEDVATLFGPIASVDGKDVAARGRSFELLPGCHLVRLLQKVGESSNDGAWVATLPPYVFAIHMRPRHRYVIRYQFMPSNGPTGTMTLDAQEQSPSGTVSRFGPASTPEDIEACRQEAAGSV